MTKNIKIFVTYHDEHPIIKSKIIYPIQTGCAIAPKRYNGMLQDDDGENISSLNNKYNELTAQYWVWNNYDKIGNPDYVGFMHYRRHFMFDDWRGRDNFVWLPNGAIYKIPFMTSGYMKHLQDKYIKKQLDDAEILIIKPYDIKNLKRPNLRTQYSHLPHQDIKNFDTFITIAKKMAPKYMYEIEMIENGSIQCLCNMFVMPKELFFEYNAFCFPILAELDRQIDSSNMDSSALRFIGYIGEFLLSIFIFHIYAQGKYKIKELNASYILCDQIILHPYIDLIRYYILYKCCLGQKRKEYKNKFKFIKKILKNKHTCP